MPTEDGFDQQKRLGQSSRQLSIKCCGPASWMLMRRSVTLSSKTFSLAWVSVPGDPVAPWTQYNKKIVRLSWVMILFSLYNLGISAHTHTADWSSFALTLPVCQIRFLRQVFLDEVPVCFTFSQSGISQCKVISALSPQELGCLGFPAGF